MVAGHNIAGRNLNAVLRDAFLASVVDQHGEEIDPDEWLDLGVFGRHTLRWLAYRFPWLAWS